MQESTDKSTNALILEAISKLGSSLMLKLEERAKAQEERAKAQALAFSEFQIRQEEFNRTVIAELTEIKKSIATIMSCIVTDYEKIIHSTKSEIEKLESFPTEVIEDIDKLVVVEKKALGGWIGDIIVKTWTKVPNTIIGIGHGIIWMMCSRKKD